MMRSRAVGGVLILLALVSIGCSGHRAYRHAQVAEQFGDWDEAVMRYLELVSQDPGNITYRSGLLRAKIKASQVHFERGKEFHEAGALERGLLEYQQAIELDPTNQYAQVEYEKLRNELAQRGKATKTLEEMKAEAKGARPQPPVLNPRSNEPITLSFPRPVSVFDIYRALGKAFGINILFDPKLRPQEIAIELQDVIAQDALEILMRAANHFYKVLDEQSIIVAEDNAQNRRVYEDLVIQTFFLSNAETTEVVTMLRSLVGAKNIAANEQLNAIVLRDTADKVKVAERIILTNDKSRGEVVIDVELLQINTSKLRELGVRLSEYNITQTIEPNPVRVSDLEFLNQNNWLLTIPSFIYQFVKNNSEAQLLASPQVRISDGEQATLHIGDRVPIPVTTFNTGQTVGGNIVPITSFQYQDVGIRLNMEPRLHHNKEVTLQLTVEVSNLSGSIQGAGGQEQPIIGTRTIESTIRLKDGETNFLAGLYQTAEQDTEVGVPGLSDIPVIGRLFSNKSVDRRRTDLVLTLTPHIIRTPDITDEDLLPIWVGTEANITFRGGSPRVESEVEGPFDEEEQQEAERIRELIRRRIQSLPRGLREGAEADEEQDEEPPGVELAPSAAPRDIFRSPDEEEEEDQEEEDEPFVGSLLLLPEDEALSASSLASEPEAGQAADSSSGLAVRVELLPAVLTVPPGESFQISVAVAAGEPVAHVPLTLEFDPEVLAVQGVDAGGFLKPQEQAKVLADFTTPGRLVLGASLLGEAHGVLGEGELARITFRAKAPGDAALRFIKSKALGVDLTAVTPLVAQTALISVAEGASPPPPLGGGDAPEGRPGPQPEERTREAREQRTDGS